MDNPELLLGLVAIALAIFLSVFFGLRGLRNTAMEKLSAVEKRIIGIGVTVEKGWDLISQRWSSTSSNTVIRELPNLGKIKITAEPGEAETKYIIEIENPLLHQDYIVKVYKEKGLVKLEEDIFGKELQMLATVFNQRRMSFNIPCKEAKLCTRYMSKFLQWLDSVYIKELPKITDFEESILSE